MCTVIENSVNNLCARVPHSKKKNHVSGYCVVGLLLSGCSLVRLGGLREHLSVGPRELGNDEPAPENLLFVR